MQTYHNYTIQLKNETGQQIYMMRVFSRCMNGKEIKKKTEGEAAVEEERLRFEGKN